jgi:hypothetical protein
MVMAEQWMVGAEPVLVDRSSKKEPSRTNKVRTEQEIVETGG